MTRSFSARMHHEVGPFRLEPLALPTYLSVTSLNALSNVLVGSFRHLPTPHFTVKSGG